MLLKDDRGKFPGGFAGLIVNWNVYLENCQL